MTSSGKQTLRILYVAPGTRVPGTDGGSVHAEELCAALTHRGHEVHLLASSDSPAPLHGHHRGFRVHSAQRRWGGRFLQWTAAGDVARLIREVRPCVVVERFYTFGGGGLWAASRGGVPAVLEVNSPARSYEGSVRDVLDRMTLWRPVERWRRTQLRLAAGLYATAAVLVPPEERDRVRVVMNGVDVERFRPGDSRWQVERMRFAFVSSFHPWHGAEDVVEATARALAEGADVEVMAIGRGARWREAVRRARQLKLGDRLRFLGAVEHDRVPELLATAHVGLAPFRPSGHRALSQGWFWSPIKLFEYLACGLPILTADIPELRDLLPERVAMFHPVGRVDRMAELMVRMAADRPDLADRARAARTVAETDFSWDRQAGEVEKLLHAVVEGDPPRGAWGTSS